MKEISEFIWNTNPIVAGILIIIFLCLLAGIFNNRE